MQNFAWLLFFFLIRHRRVKKMRHIGLTASVVVLRLMQFQIEQGEMYV